MYEIKVASSSLNCVSIDINQLFFSVLCIHVYHKLHLHENHMFWKHGKPSTGAVIHHNCKQKIYAFNLNDLKTENLTSVPINRY